MTIEKTKIEIEKVIARWCLPECFFTGAMGYPTRWIEYGSGKVEGRGAVQLAKPEKRKKGRVRPRIYRAGPAFLDHVRPVSAWCDVFPAPIARAIRIIEEAGGDPLDVFEPAGLAAWVVANVNGLVAVDQAGALGWADMAAREPAKVPEETPPAPVLELVPDPVSSQIGGPSPAWVLPDHWDAPIDIGSSYDLRSDAKTLGEAVHAAAERLYNASLLSDGGIDEIASAAAERAWSGSANAGNLAALRVDTAAHLRRLERIISEIYMLEDIETIEELPELANAANDRPDLLVASKDGREFVIEIKTGRSVRGLWCLGQVEKYCAQRYAETRKAPIGFLIDIAGGRAARCVLPGRQLDRIQDAALSWPVPDRAIRNTEIGKIEALRPIANALIQRGIYKLGELFWCSPSLLDRAGFQAAHEILPMALRHAIERSKQSA